MDLEAHRAGRDASQVLRAGEEVPHRVDVGGDVVAAAEDVLRHRAVLELYKVCTRLDTRVRAPGCQGVVQCSVLKLSEGWRPPAPVRHLVPARPAAGTTTRPSPMPSRAGAPSCRCSCSTNDCWRRAPLRDPGSCAARSPSSTFAARAREPAARAPRRSPNRGARAWRGSSAPRSCSRATRSRPMAGGGTRLSLRCSSGTVARLELHEGLLLVEPERGPHGRGPPLHGVHALLARARPSPAPCPPAGPSVDPHGGPIDVRRAPCPRPGRRHSRACRPQVRRAARERLERWVSGGLAGYRADRDGLDGVGTSHLGVRPALRDALAAAGRGGRARGQWS